MPTGGSFAYAALDPTAGTVIENVACIGCGYNLRTLALSTSCPECALPVFKSMRPDPLHYVHPRWLKDVRRGFGFAAFYFVLSLFLLIQTPLLALVINPASKALVAFANPFTSFGVGAVVLWAMGLLDIATEEPHRAHDRRGNRLRRWVGALGLLAPVILILTLCATAGLGALARGQDASAMDTTWSILARFFLFVPLRLIIELGALALGLYLCHLAIRSRRSKRVFTVFTTVSGLYVVARISVHLVGLLCKLSTAGGQGKALPGTLPMSLVVAQAAELLLGVAFGVIGLIAMFVARKMISEALNQQTSSL